LRGSASALGRRFDELEETYPTMPKRWPWRPLKLLDMPERRLEALDRAEAPGALEARPDWRQRQPSAGATWVRIASMTCAL
jgi:hypothetical protein